jgi:hypothetical protein
MPFLILPTFVFVCRPQRAQSTNDRHIESLDSNCLSIWSALTRAARTADCGFGHSLGWRMRSMKHQFNYGRSATGGSEVVSPTCHAFTPSALKEKSLTRRPSHNLICSLGPWPFVKDCAQSLFIQPQTESVLIRKLRYRLPIFLGCRPNALQLIFVNSAVLPFIAP